MQQQTRLEKAECISRFSYVGKHDEVKDYKNIVRERPMQHLSTQCSLKEFRKKVFHDAGEGYVDFIRSGSFIDKSCDNSRSGTRRWPRLALCQAGHGSITTANNRCEKKPQWVSGRMFDEASVEAPLSTMRTGAILVAGAHSRRHSC